MSPKIETFKVVWKIIRRKGYPSTRTPATYCDFIIENENRTHRLKTVEETDLFKLLESTTISKNEKYSWSVFVDGIYYGDKLVSITNPRKI